MIKTDGSVARMKKEYDENVAPDMWKRYKKSYQKHRKFVKEFFGINLPKTYA